jgi:hypothetical protein
MKQSGTAGNKKFKLYINCIALYLDWLFSGLISAEIFVSCQLKVFPPSRLYV